MKETNKTVREKIKTLNNNNNNRKLKYTFGG